MSPNKRVAGASKLARRAANISLSSGVLDDARELGINISRACEVGLEAQIARVRRERWLAENKPALESSNAYAQANGLPLARLRQF